MITAFTAKEIAKDFRNKENIVDNVLNYVGKEIHEFARLGFFNLAIDVSMYGLTEENRDVLIDLLKHRGFRVSKEWLMIKIDWS